MSRLPFDKMPGLCPDFELGVTIVRFGLCVGNRGARISAAVFRTYAPSHFTSLR